MCTVFLLSFFVQSAQVEQRIAIARDHIFERQRFHIRLEDILTSLSRSGGHSPLYTKVAPKEERESLFFLFDQGIDPDPLFSGAILGRLYLDQTRSLCLASWPVQEMPNPPVRTEVLLQNIETLSFAFLGKDEQKDATVTWVTPTIGWYPRWPDEMTALPSILRIQCTQKGVPTQFAFRLAVPDPIVYRTP